MISKSSPSFSWLQSVGYVLFSKIVGIFKATIIFGSSAAFFSAANIIVPLSGAFGGVIGCSRVFGISLVLRILTTGFIGFHALAYHIPGFFASLAWTTRSKWLHVGVPAVCMILFNLHPIGLSSMPYSFYWIIPILCSLVRPSLFTTALSSTFIAHAVGSVIWIYTVPMTVLQWYSLLPIVAAERLAFALGMVAVYQLVMFVRTTKSTRRSLVMNIRSVFGFAQ